MQPVVGWDVGGVNTKAALVTDGTLRAHAGEPYEIRHDPAALAGVLRSLAARLGAPAGAAHALTMTAELSQAFRTKAEGVAHVLDAACAAFPGADLAVYATDARFADLATARAEPLRVAAANWTATAALVARDMPDAVLVDIGTTSTDIIPIAAGRIAARGRTDPDRLASGELLYTGALRTPVDAIVSEVPWGPDGRCGVSADGFCIVGDVHVWLGALDPADYSVPAPDGRPPTRAFAGERLARVICADRTMLGDADLDAIARHVADAQVARVAEAIGRVVARLGTRAPAVVTGLGAWIAADAARRAGLAVVPLADRLGDAARVAPAAAVALLRAAELAAQG